MTHQNSNNSPDVSPQPDVLNNEVIAQPTTQLELPATKPLSCFAHAWERAGTYLLDEQVAKYCLGKILAELQDAHAKPGIGDFGERLAEFSVFHQKAVATLYRRIQRYRLIAAGVETTLLEKRTQNQVASLPWASIDEFDRDALEAEGAERKLTLNAILGAARETVLRAKQQKKTAAPTVTLKLTTLPEKEADDVRVAHGRALKALGGERSWAAWYCAIVRGEVQFRKDLAAQGGEINA